MTERKEIRKGWITTSMRKNQYNGLSFLAAKEYRAVTQQLYLMLKKAGVPEMTDEQLEKESIGVMIAR